MDAMAMFGKPQGGDDEYTDGKLNAKFVKNAGRSPGEEKEEGSSDLRSAASESDQPVAPTQSLSQEDERERVKRVLKVDVDCTEALVKDVDFANTIGTADDFGNIVLSKGEKVTASIQCVAIRGMPAADDSEDLIGKGVLVLSELDGANRLHFAMYGSKADFEAEEVWKEQKSGCLCCTKYTHNVYADYKCTRNQSLVFTTLPIANNIFDVYGSLIDIATLNVFFGANNAKKSGPCCPKCCGCSCSCFCCCKVCCICCKGHQKAEGFWAKQTSMRPVLSHLLEKTSHDVERATYKFPGVKGMQDQERKTQKVEKMHMINFSFLSTDGMTMSPCAIFANPDEPALKVAKFAAALGALTSVQAAPKQDSM